MAAVNHARLKQLFLEIVQIDSLSRREREVALRLVRELESAGLRCRFDGAAEKVHGNCGNLIGHLDGTREGVAPLLLCAHMDTVVPGEGVKPVVDGDIIRTDGSTVLGGDDKSGCAIICEVLHQLREQKIAHGPIDAVFTVCEEIGLQGARNLDLSLLRAREGLVFDSDSPGYLFVRAAGAQGLRFTVRGLEAHAGMAPERGLSAIKIAAEAIAAMRLGRIDDETTANLGTIQGGRAGNIVPNEVVVRGEARSNDPLKLTAQVEHMIGCFKEAVARAAVTVDGKAVRGRAGISQRAFLRRDERARGRADRAQSDRGRTPRWAARSSRMRPAADATPTFSISADWWSPTWAPACATSTRCANGSTSRDMTATAEVTLELIKLQRR